MKTRYLLLPVELLFLSDLYHYTVNQLQQLILGDRLRHIPAGSKGNGLFRIGKILISTDKYDLGGGGMLPDLIAQLQPIHTRHTDISQNDIGKPPCIRYHTPGILPVTGRVDFRNARYLG